MCDYVYNRDGRSEIVAFFLEKGKEFLKSIFLSFLDAWRVQQIFECIYT